MKSVRKQNILYTSLTYVATFVVCMNFAIGVANAAEFRVSDSGNKTKSVHVSGKIEAGDVEKLSKALTSALVLTVELNSPGGNLIEGMRMGELIRPLRLVTRVEEGGVCASACFFIWMAGARRNANESGSPNLYGRVGLHRPYLASPENSENSLSNQYNVMQGVTTYLESKLIPRRLIDFMMARPSNNIYWLTEEDLEELGRVPPDLEELYVSKCGYDRKLKVQQLDAMQRGDSRLLDTLNKKMQVVSECQGDVDITPYLQGLKKLRTGWVPESPISVGKSRDVTPKPDLVEQQVEKAHPGWRSLVKTAAFNRWLAAQPKNIRQLSESTKIDDAILLLDLYKRDLQTGK